MAKTKPRLSEKEVLDEFKRRDEVLTDFEEKHIGVLVSAILVSEEWRKHKDDPKLGRKMQEARQQATDTFPDLSRRMHLNQVIIDLL